MRYSIRTVGPIAPAEAIAPVVSTDEAKAHLNVDGAEDDALIEALVLAAQDHVERHTSQVLTPREMEISFGAFPSWAPAGHRTGEAFEIPRTPVTGIVSILYTDADGVAAELAEADWRWSESAAELVRPAFGTSWPTAYDEAGSVRIRFEAGYDEGLAPASLTAAVLRLTAYLYDSRGAMPEKMPEDVLAFCRPYRRVAI